MRHPAARPSAPCQRRRGTVTAVTRPTSCTKMHYIYPRPTPGRVTGRLGSRVVSVLDSGAEGPGSNRGRDAVG